MELDENDVIIALTVKGLPCMRLQLGDRVTSNGRFVSKKGTEGSVVELKVPFENGRTNDVIIVKWEGNKIPASMKFKDLDDFVPCRKAEA